MPSDTITAEVEVIEVPTARNDYTDGYDERIAEIEREKAAAASWTYACYARIYHI